MQVVVLDSDLFSSEVIGQVVVDLKRLKRDVPTDEWYPVAPCPESTCRPSGSLRIRLLRSNNMLLSRIRHAQNTVEAAVKQTMRCMKRLHASGRVPWAASPTLDTLLTQLAGLGLPAGSTTQLDDRPLSAVAPYDVLSDYRPKANSGRVGTRALAAAADAAAAAGVEESKGEGEGDVPPAIPALAGAAASAATPATGAASPAVARGDAPAKALGRLVGHQLQVRISRAEGVGRHVVGGEDGPLATAAKPQWLYATLRVGNAVRRTAVQQLGFDVAFRSAPLGLSFLTTGTGGGAPGQGLVVARVDGQALARAVHPGSLALAACIAPGMVVVGVSGSSLADVYYAEARSLLRTAVTALSAAGAASGDRLWLRFVPGPVTLGEPTGAAPELVAPPRVPRSHATVVPLVDLSVAVGGAAGAGAVSRSERAAAWQREASVHWGDTLLFGDAVAPTSAYVPLLNGYSTGLGCDPVMEVCLVQRACAEDGSFLLGLSDGPILGSGACACLRTCSAHALLLLGGGGGIWDVACARVCACVWSVRTGEIGQAGQDTSLESQPTEAESLSAMYFVGDNASMDRAVRPDRGIIHRRDRIVGVVKRLALPPVGHVLNTWLPVAVRGGAAGAGAAAAALRVRVEAQWVPLYAARECLRSTRVAVHFAGVGVSVIDQSPKVCGWVGWRARARAGAPVVSLRSCAAIYLRPHNAGSFLTPAV